MSTSGWRFVAGDTTIGILALQGDFRAHQVVLKEAGFATKLVRTTDDLDSLDGLVLPGGESTTMLRLLQDRQIWQRLDALVRQGLPVFTTCAGTILAAKEVTHPSQTSFGWLPITVVRNAYGDQRHSFVASVGAADRWEWMPLIFIRAPQITHVGEGVEVLLWHGDKPVLVAYQNILAATFHPEIANDPTLYRFWFNDCKRAASNSSPRFHTGI